MKHLLIYTETEDFVNEQGQGDYVLSVKPGVAYIMERGLVKYNGDFDLVIQFGTQYTADTQTSAFIDALYNNSLDKFRILIKGIHSGIEEPVDVVVDETWSTWTGTDWGGNPFRAFKNDDFRNDFEFIITGTTPKKYAGMLMED